MKYILNITTFSLMVLLSGCGSYYWVNYTRPSASFEKDEVNCTHQSNQQFPPKLYQKHEEDYFAVQENKRLREEYIRKMNSPGLSMGLTPLTPYSPMRTSVQTTQHKQVGNSFESTTIHQTPPYIPPPIYRPEYRVVTIDANKDVRAQAFKKCMMDLGWHLQYKK